MIAPRLVQNFRDVRALVVAGSNAQLGFLEAALERLGLDVERVEALAALPGMHEDRTIIFVDGDLAQPLVLPLSPSAGLPPVPVIGLIGVETPGRLRAMMGLGATAFLRKPVHGASIYPALYLGVNEHRRQRELERRLQQQEARLRGRRFVMRAVVQLAVQHGLDDERAYALLRRESMRSRRSLEDYCESLADSACHTSQTPIHLPDNTEVHHAALRP